MSRKLTVLTMRRTYPSSRLLAAGLKELLGIDVRVTRMWDTIDEDTFVVRYGNMMGHFPYQINSPDFIRICGRKLRTQAALSGIVDTPHFYTQEVKPDKYPALIRTTLTGFGGQGAHVVENEMEFDSFVNSINRFHWTPMRPIVKEYRVHMLGGKLCRFFQKVRVDGQPDIVNPIRNSGNGYRFSLRYHIDEFPGLLEFVNKVSDALTYDFVAMDVGFCSDTQSYMLIELNSAPGLNTPTSVKYAEFIAERYKSV